MREGGSPRFVKSRQVTERRVVECGDSGVHFTLTLDDGRYLAVSMTPDEARAVGALLVELSQKDSEPAADPMEWYCAESGTGHLFDPNRGRSACGLQVMINAKNKVTADYTYNCQKCLRVAKAKKAAL